MPRYVMASRRAGKFTDREKGSSREAFDSTFTSMASAVRVVNDSAPATELDRRVVVFDAEPGELPDPATMPGDVLLEPEILHYTDVVAPAGFRRTSAVMQDTPLAFPGTQQLTVTATGSGSPLEGAEVILFLRGSFGSQASRAEVTAADGVAHFSFADFWQAAALIVVPAGGFWAMVVRGPQGTLTVDCPPLPETGPLGWWHSVHGVQEFDAHAGAGVRVGVADTGTGPHECLDHAADAGAFINGAHLPDGGADVDSHGTHVSGTIGARPMQAGQFAGLAPGVDLFSARVFPPGAGANQGDIANAIDELSRTHRADLINLSLGAPAGSRIEQDAIRDALERGTLCICAAANSAGPVEFPAAFPESVAVSALGIEGWGPPGSLASTRLPFEEEKFGDDNLYLANFSCFGPEISACGAGVAVIAPVPARFQPAPYSAMSGTSMASPSVTGALAVLLANSPAYGALPRNGTRAEAARMILIKHCRDIGLKTEFQGHGLPNLTC